MTPCPHDATGSGSGSVESRIRDLLAATVGKRGKKKLGPDDNLISPNSGFDSIAFMEFVLRLEDHFGIHIPDEELRIDTFQSIQTIEAYIREKTESQSTTHSTRPEDNRAGFELQGGDEPCEPSPSA
jgi:acyl carrier protein